MRQTLFLQKGLTLTELLVASVIVGIIMVGVASFTSSMKNVQKTSVDVSLNATRTAAAMKMIERDALLAIGDSTDAGVCTPDTGPTDYSVCFRQDTANTPWDYTDDTWICYHHGATQQIKRCVWAGGASPCSGYSDASCSALTYVTSVNLDPFASIVLDGSGQIEYLQLQIQTATDPTAACAINTNPCSMAEGKVSLPLQSRN